MPVEQVDGYGRTSIPVHFVFMLPERIACQPSMTEFHSTPHHPSYQRSNDPRAVTCKHCKETDNYKAAMEALRAK